MAKLVPQALDQRVGLYDVDLSNRVLCELTEVRVGPDDGVFRAAVGQNLDLRARDTRYRLPQNLSSPLSRQARLKRTRQHPPGEAIDDSVQVATGPVEQLDDGHVNMEPLIGSRRAKTDLGLRWVETTPRPAPAELAYHSTPRPTAREDLAKALPVQGQRTQREMLEVVAFDHVSHGNDLSSSKAPRLSTGTRRTIVEHAQRLPALPYAEPSLAEADNLECGAPSYHILHANDRSEDSAFRLRGGDSRFIKREPADTSCRICDGKLGHAAGLQVAPPNLLAATVGWEHDVHGATVALFRRRKGPQTRRHGSQ